MVRMIMKQSITGSLNSAGMGKFVNREVEGGNERSLAIYAE